MHPQCPNRQWLLVSGEAMSLEAKVIVVLLAVIAIALAFLIPAMSEWSDQCESRGGIAQSEEIGSVNNAPIFFIWCEGPDGKEIKL